MVLSTWPGRDLQDCPSITLLCGILMDPRQGHITHLGKSHQRSDDHKHASIIFTLLYKASINYQRRLWTSIHEADNTFTINLTARVGVVFFDRDTRFRLCDDKKGSDHKVSKFG